MPLASLARALQNANTGLQAMQGATALVSHNIANVNTPGYVKKNLQLQTQTLAGEGSGVSVSSPKRHVDEFLLHSLRDAFSSYLADGYKETYNDQLQTAFGTPADNMSFTHMLEKVVANLSSLSSDPSNPSVKGVLVGSLQEATTSIQRLGQLLNDLRSRADSEISDSVQKVNDLLKKIAGYNIDISTNGDASDLEDLRDNAVNELSQLMNISYFKDNNGRIQIFTKNGEPLLTQDVHEISHFSSGTVAPTSSREDGSIDGIYVGARSPSHDITDQIVGGKLGALIELRDSLLPNYQRQLDSLSSNLAEQLNEAHNGGTSLPPPSQLKGTQYFMDPANQRLSFAGVEDSRVLILDKQGHQLATATVREILNEYNNNNPNLVPPMDFPNPAPPAPAPNYPMGATLNQYSLALQEWLHKTKHNGGPGLPNAKVEFSGTNALGNPMGTLSIKLNYASAGIGFMDVEDSTLGAKSSVAHLSFNADGDPNTGVAQKKGFSNFFGLNDILKVPTKPTENSYETKVLDKDVSLGLSGFLKFYTEKQGVGVGPPPPVVGTLAISPGDTLEDLAWKINHDINLKTKFSATIEKDGKLFRLRVSTISGDNFLTSDSTGTINNILGFKPMNVGASMGLGVIQELLRDPTKLASGQPTWDPSLGLNGAYAVSANNSKVSKSLMAVFKQQHNFETTGDLSGGSMSLSGYSDAILNHISGDIFKSTSRAERKDARVYLMQKQISNETGVNLDEELKDLIVFQRSYTASAKIITTVDKMLASLVNMI